MQKKLTKALSVCRVRLEAFSTLTHVTAYSVHTAAILTNTWLSAALVLI